MSIKIEHVSHLYGEGEAFEKKALDDVTLEIPDGQFLGDHRNIPAPENRR